MQKYKDYKFNKLVSRTLSNYIDDIFNSNTDNLSLEENIIIVGIINYIIDNIMKKDKYKELLYYILIYFVKYILNIAVNYDYINININQYLLSNVDVFINMIN